MQEQLLKRPNADINITLPKGVIDSIAKLADGALQVAWLDGLLWGVVGATLTLLVLYVLFARRS